MADDELRKVISDALSGEDFITNKKVDVIRNALEKAYVADDYPVLNGLEESWKILEDDYQVIDRSDHPSSNPLSSFIYYVDLGFYPPPEIMLALCVCFERYIEAEGDLSLDEAFFGHKHKKRKSHAYREGKLYKYFLFHKLWASGMRRRVDGDLNSLEKLAEDYLGSLFANKDWEDDMDVDSFLRGYRRWVKEMKSDSNEK
jgi:hypothetical protein